MRTGSRSISNCQAQACTAKNHGAVGSTLPSTRRTISLNGRSLQRSPGARIGLGLALSSYCLPAREMGQVQVCQQGQCRREEMESVISLEPCQERVVRSTVVFLKPPIHQGL